MPDINAEYRKQFMRKQLSFEKEYREIFNKVADDFARLSYDPNIKFAKAFIFPKYIKERMKVMMTDFHDQVLELTKTEIEGFWDLSNQKNDKLVTNYLETISTIKARQQAAYFMPNTSALKAFLSTAHGTETLSESVWKIARQYRKELETHLGIGVAQGDSADVISRRIRQYLKNPDALFRRVRDKNGKLVASKAMSEYHPGQGVYKSAYKNAMRVTRSETNAAYHLADMLRWEQLDMVKGFEIKLSASHVIFDICDECVGIYPKTFIFTGFHPQCMCNAVPVMSSQQDFLEYLRTGDREVNNMVTQYPENFKNYVKDNFERYSNYKSVPFWITDNKEIIKNIVKK